MKNHEKLYQTESCFRWNPREEKTVHNLLVKIAHEIFCVITLLLSHFKKSMWYIPLCDKAIFTCVIK